MDPLQLVPGFTTTVSALVHLEMLADDAGLAELESTCQDAQVGLERVVGLMHTHRDQLTAGDAGEPS